MGFFSRLFKLDDKASQLDESFATELLISQREADAIRAELDIDSAIAAHENWKLRLQKVLEGTSDETLDPETVCLDNRCDLGKWIHGPGGQRLGSYPAFQVLVSRHKFFHEQAATVLVQAQSGAAEDANKTLSSGYRYASGQVVLLLKELKRSLAASRT